MTSQQQQNPSVSLRKRRRWYAPEDPATPAPDAPQQDQAQPAASAETENTVTAPVEHMIPKSRFDEINDRAKAAEAELAKFKADQDKAETERKKKQGEFEELYTSEQTKTADLTSKLTAATERLEKLEAVFKTQLDKRVEALPDHIKPLIAHMDALEALTYLDANADKFVTPQDGSARKQAAPSINATDGARSNGTGKGDVVLNRPIRA
jgi:hypothetical protein